MIFSRKSDDALASLVKKLDKVIQDNSDQQFKVFVAFLGGNPGELKTAVTKFSEKTNTKGIPYTIAVEQPDGPETYGLSEDADYTVLVYKNVKVVANHAVKKGKLSKKVIADIVKDTQKVLN
tara:strand:- start:385 stop:750 length:366 start_codon:yes stop_codon:yes gene_type:complete